MSKPLCDIIEAVAHADAEDLVKRLTFSDIESMVDSHERESNILDYKRDLPGRTEKDKKEFCEDIAALANSLGGAIVYGVAEGTDAGRESGVPESVVGVALSDADAETLRLGSVLRSGLSPRAPGIDVYVAEEEGEPRRKCLVVSVPRSMSRPHMVTSGGVASRFWARSGAGKYFMDVREIREAFEASGEWVERLRLWRADRVSSLAVGQGAVPTATGPAVVLHVVPLSAFQAGGAVSLSEHLQLLNSEVRPLFFTVGGVHWRWNFDGYLATSGRGDVPSGYSQVFRSGLVEGVDFSHLKGQATVPAAAIEQGVIDFALSTRAVLYELGVQGAIALLLTLVNIDGFRLAIGGQSVSDYECDRDLLVLPEAILEEDDADVEGALRPAFDSLWQAFGSAGSPRYRNAGDGVQVERTQR